LVVDSGSSATNNGTIVFTDYVNLSGETLSGGTFELAVGGEIDSTVTLDGATLLIDSGAFFNWNGDYIATTTNGGTLTNNGTIALNSDIAGLPWTLTVVNNGIVNWNVSDTDAINQFGGITVLSGLTISGSIEVTSGTTLQFSGDVFYEGGTLTIDSGATLDWDGGYLFADDPVTVNNYGTIDYGSGAFATPNDGTSLTINNYGSTVGTLQWF